MNFFRKVKFSQNFLQAKLFKRKIPLIVGWNLTYRCNLSCKYCGWWGNKGSELNNTKTISLIEELAFSGTKIVSFGGGEPLLREDLGEIVNFCKRKKMYVTISSNGTLIKEKVKEVQRADKIKFSLDGPERMNDLIRGAGVHRKVLEAIEICKNKGIEVDLNTVISKYTKFSSILYLFDIARKYNVGIYFQPVDQDYSGNSSKDITSCLPDEKYFKKIITFLIEEKLKGNTFINNSISGLKYIYNWPYGKKIKCLASRIFCSISPEGKIFICDNFPHYQQYLVPVKGSFKKSFYNLSLPHDCNQCWNASMLELNLMSRMRPQFFFDIWKRLKK